MNVHVDVCSAGVGINKNVKLGFSHYLNVVPIVLLSMVKIYIKDYYVETVF